MTQQQLIYKWSMIFIVALLVMLLGLLFINFSVKKITRVSPETTTKPTTDLQVLPQIHTKKPVSYKAKRDPFIYADVTASETTSQQVTQPLVKEKLTEYPVNVLKFIGVISLGDKFWGIVETPNGLAHRVEIGTPIGINNGYVYQITNNQIIIHEKISVGDGKWIEHTAVLKLDNTTKQTK